MKTSIAIVMFFIAATAFGDEPRSRTEGHQAAYLYLTNSADNDIRQGHYKGLAGIANGDPAAGDPYWYLSRKPRHIYRIPYSEHLGTNFAFEYRAVRVRGKTGRACDHIGDIDNASVEVDGERIAYLVGGFDNCHDGNRGQLAFFLAADIGEVGGVLEAHAEVDVGEVQQKGAPWAAFGAETKLLVDGAWRPAVRVYSSSGSTRDSNAIFEYVVLWEDVQKGGRIPYRSHRRIDLVDFDGNAVHLDRRQGGDLSTDGELFFVSQGMTDYNWEDAEIRQTDRRLLAFEVGPEGSPWKLLKRSNNGRKPFQFQTSSDQEPEGLSYFDVNEIPGYRSNMPRGELFVTMIDHFTKKCWGPWYNKECTHQAVFIKHYTGRIKLRPGDSITGAVLDDWHGHGAWDRSVVMLEPGTYRETVHLRAEDLWAPDGDSSKSLKFLPLGQVRWLAAGGP